jgi:GTP pyrophosphokinase
MDRFVFLREAENRETFFTRISFYYSTLDPRHQAILKAYNAAKDAFRGIAREGGERYFEHIRAVALIMIDYMFITDHELIIAAKLHDIVEDNPAWTITRVEQEFGKKVAFLVELLTKPPVANFNSKEERDAFYHGRFVYAPREFFLVKLPDRLHNILTLGVCTKEKRERKIAETEMYYLPYAKRELILAHELIEALDVAKASLRK